MLLKARKKCTLKLQRRYSDLSSVSEVLGKLFLGLVLEHSTDLSHAQTYFTFVMNSSTVVLISIYIHVFYIHLYLK